MSPNSSIPAPAGVPTGNGRYIAAVALLLLVVGGLVFWKYASKPKEVVENPTPPKPSSSVMVLNNVEDDIPPPVAEDAGLDSGPQKTQVAYTGSGCDSKKCAGTTSSDLEAALAQRARQSHRCYDNALAQDPTLRGKVSIAVRVGTNGSSCSATIASNELANSQVSQCVVGYFRGGGFPLPRGGCVDTVIPINFVNKL